MSGEFTAVIEREGDWFIAYCPEIPGANGLRLPMGQKPEDFPRLT